MKQQISAADVAAYLVAQCANEGHPLTQLELQKLLAMCQSLYARNHDGDPLFLDKVEAWDLGPAVRDVYRLYRDYGDNSIIAPATRLVPLDSSALSVIADVITRFSGAGVSALLSATHNDVWKRYHRAHGHEEIPVSALASSWPDYEKAATEPHDDLLDNMPATQTFTQAEFDSVKDAVAAARKVRTRFTI